MHLIRKTLWTLTSFIFILNSFSTVTAAVTDQRTAQHDFTSVAHHAVPAVVSIQVKTKSLHQNESSENLDFFNDDFFQRFFGSQLIPQIPEMELGQASGFIVSPEGHIITNSHVVKNATEIEVTLNDDRHFSAKVVGQDPSTDVAVLKIDAKDLPFLKLANSDDIKIGQWAVAIGTPLGLKASLTVGVVSAKGRNNLDIARIEDFIQTDAAINRGNSGGPLLNLDSQVIGMNTAIVSNNGGGGYMGIGFAIPSNIIKNDLEQILTNGSVSRGFIGVVLQQVDSDLAQALSLEKVEGALVADVSRDSPAEKAGIKPGDVILSYNGNPINSIGALRNAIALMSPGTKVKLKIVRKDKSIADVSVEVANFPQQSEVAETKGQKENKLGIEVQELTPELARSLQYGDQRGVVISKVQSNSPAAWAGLKKGTLIVSIDHQAVQNLEQFYRLLETHDMSKPMLLLVKQGDVTRFISIRIK